MFPLDIVLRRTVRCGRLRVQDHDGCLYDFGEADAPISASVILHDRKAARFIARNPALNIGEAYVDGRLTVSQGSLLSFTGLLLQNMQFWNASPLGRIFYSLENLAKLPSVLNWMRRAQKNVKHHYDLSGELFSLFLDSDQQYSCAYYRNPGDDLEKAQLSKKQHITAKLHVHPGQHLLDIGSGWGGLAFYLARHYPVRVTGLTLSEEQYRVSNARAQQLGLADRVTFKLADYRKETGQYDRIVSVGMFEHVGRPYFGAFFRKLTSLLKPDGVALIHTIGFQTPPSQINPWIKRYIFPGAYLPALSQITPIIERRRLWLSDLENLRLHYAYTLADWHERFQANRDYIAKLYDERFCRMWEFYLQSCEAGFRWSGMTVFQFQLTKRIDTLPNTRDYIQNEEARLREADIANAQPPRQSRTKPEAMQP